MRNAALLLALSAGPAMAQTPGLPVYGGGFSPTIEVEGLVGFPEGETPSGKGTTFGARGTLAFGRFGVSATVASFNPSNPGSAQVAYGAMLGLKVIGTPLSPFALYLQGGAGGIDNQVADSSQVQIPVGLAATLVIPTPIISIKPWVAPRLHVVSTSVAGGTTSASEFAIGAGVDLTLLGGISFRAAYDRIKDQDGTLGLSLALHL